MSCTQIWNIEQEKDREKEKVSSRPAKLNNKKGDRDLEWEIKKNKGAIFLLEEQHENFVAEVTTWGILAATNARWKWAEVKQIVNKNTYDISSKKCVTKKFLELSRCSHTKSNGKEMYKKKCAARAKMLFC